MNTTSMYPKNKLSNYMLDQDIRYYYALLMIYSSVLAPLICIFSSLTYWAVVLYPGFRSGFHYIIGSISFADFLTGVYCVPMYVLSCHPLTRTMILGNRLACLARLTCLELTGGASIVCMYLLTVDRFIAVMNPRKYSKIVTSDKALRVILFAWLLAMLWSSLPLMSWNRYDASVELMDRRCHINRSLPDLYVYILVCKVPVFLGMAALLSGWFVLATICQRKVYRKTSHMYSTLQCRKTEDRFKSVAMTFTLLSMTIAVWGAYILIVPLEFVQLFNRKQNEVLVVSSHLLVFNFSLVRPATYMLQKEFRQVIKAMLTTSPCGWRTRLSRLHGVRCAIVNVSLPVEVEEPIHRLVPTLSETFDVGDENSQIELYSGVYRETSLKEERVSVSSERDSRKFEPIPSSSTLSSRRSLKSVFRRNTSALSLGKSISFTNSRADEDEKTLSTFTINSKASLATSNRSDKASLASRKRVNFGSGVDPPTTGKTPGAASVVATKPSDVKDGATPGDSKTGSSSRSNSRASSVISGKSLKEVPSSSSMKSKSSSSRPILKNRDGSHHGSLPSSNSTSDQSSRPGTDESSTPSSVTRHMRQLIERLRRHNPIPGPLTKVKWHPDTKFSYKESEEAAIRETEV